MLITPSTLAYARARHHDLAREADHERLLRAARVALRACCGGGADEARCTSGCCEAPGRCAEGADDCAGGIAALLLRAVRSVRPARATRCAPSCAAA